MPALVWANGDTAGRAQGNRGGVSIPHYYLTQSSATSRESLSTEVGERAFPVDLHNRPPDFEDKLSTKLCGYAMARIELHFHSHILAGRTVYTVISDDWRISSWLDTP